MNLKSEELFQELARGTDVKTKKKGLKEMPHLFESEGSKGSKAKEYNGLENLEKAKVYRKEHTVADPLVLAQNDQCQTSVLLSCKITYLCYFKPLHFLAAVAAAVN